MLNEMKCVDETFREVYLQNNYVGSYYENLRVEHPSEFDINLELQLPISESCIEVCFITIMLGGENPVPMRFSWWWWWWQ
jgi:hypothetical protein